jgi:PmbA protein
MNQSDIADYCIEQLKKVGAHKSQCDVTFSEKKELNVETGEMSLFRTTFDTNVGMSVIVDQKSGSVAINKTDKESINEAVKKVMNMAQSSQPDDANDISPSQPKQSFSKGDEEPDMEKMYLRLDEFMGYVKQTHPTINMEAAIVDFSHSTSVFQNSNGVEFATKEGMYGFSNMFTAKEGKDTSSFNGMGISALNLNTPFIESGSAKRLLKQSTEQVRTKPVSEKFTGEIVVTPDCLSDFLGFITGDISDGKIISKTSIYKERLHQQITDPRFTLHARPVSDEITDGYFITDDGYVAENNTIIDNGVLKTHLLSLYGANKTGGKRAVNGGGAFVVDAGEKPKDEIIRNIKKGILLERFSGGRPSADGEFSGVAKNSYYIENGELKYPISETMISGNIKEMFSNIGEISSDRIDFGYCIFPWISFKGVTVS